MNKDLLIKLVKLANNNPNEHEANAAARRVCQMLEADGYLLVNGARPTQMPVDIFTEALRNQQNAYKYQQPRQDIYEKTYVFICQKCHMRVTTNNLLTYANGLCQECLK